MTRPIAATACLLAACTVAARGGGWVRVTVAGRPTSDWRASGLASATLAHLARAQRLCPASHRAASRLLPAEPGATDEQVAAAARLLRAQWVVLVSGGEGEARARLFRVARSQWQTVTVAAPSHELPGRLALALVEAMGLRPAQEERERIGQPMVANAAAMEALWRGDAQPDAGAQLHHYRQAQRHDPASATVQNQIGAALARRGAHEEALEAFGRAVELQPDSVAAHTNRGLVLKRLARWDAAEEALRRAIDLGTKSPTPYVALARLLDRKGAAREAVEQLEKAVALDPCHVGALMTLADVSFAQQRFKGARRRVGRILELEPEHAAALNLRGLLQLIPRDYRAAEASFRKALAAEPDSPTTVANLGLALYGQKRVKEAIETVQRAIALDGRNATAHFYLGRIYLGERRFEEAAEALQRAVEFDPHLLPARKALQEARARRRGPGDGCGCLPFSAGSPTFAGRVTGSLFPVALLLCPHVIRLSRRRRRR